MEEVVFQRAEGFTLSSDRNLLVLSERIAKERGISREQAVDEIQEAYVQAAEAEHGPEYLFWAKIAEDGAVFVAQVLRAVEVMRNPYREVALLDLQSTYPDAQLGQYIVNAITPVHPPKLADWLVPRATEISNVELKVT